MLDYNSGVPASGQLLAYALTFGPLLFMLIGRILSGPEHVEKKPSRRPRGKNYKVARQYHVKRTF